MKHLLCLPLFGLLVACGAAVGNVDIVAPQARYPISLTPGLADAEGLVARSRIRTVAPFAYQSDGCIDEEIDISEELNRQIASAGGHAITKLSIEAQMGSSCVSFRLTGEIVQVAPRGGPR